MRTEDNTHEKFEKNLWDICLCSATCNCINNDRLFLGNFRNSCLNVFEKQHHSFLPSPKIRGVFLVFEIWTKRGVMKKLLRNRGLVEREGGSSQKEEGFQIVSSVFLQKSMFSLLLDFFCLVNIHTCCNQQIYSFMWFSFYQKMIYYEISFPLTLIFNYNFVKISLLMTFISISNSLKTSKLFENKSQVFERSD